MVCGMGWWDDALGGWKPRAGTKRLTARASLHFLRSFSFPSRRGRPMAWRAAPLLLAQLSLLPAPGADAQVSQDFELWQPQDPVTVAAGQTLTLTCTTFGDGPTGPVKWLKGKDSGNETVYDQTGSFPRVTRAVSWSNTDFTIHIRDVQPEDADTYYCVKFRKTLRGEEEFRRGKGTEVSVRETNLIPGILAAAVVLCFLLLLGLLVALFLYRRKRLAGQAATSSFSTIPLHCCAGTPSTSSKVLDAETSHLPSWVRVSHEYGEEHLMSWLAGLLQGSKARVGTG
ncbi:signal-regulatory protein beta-1-like isoform X2 [Cuculus canorus]|uniref:signal-regulatory protein beta-1-like isoform X2 n=1 Tax=Cuculus canorus TaxID=55661 RepID=UPI0023AB152B|nr:signal-regulatory protein beta-1-like isoform X2 [Cuculus canorus]